LNFSDFSEWTQYYYFINQDFQRCIYDLFFVNAEILKYKNLYSLFSNEIVSYQLDGGMLSPSDFLVEGDTFIYEKNTIEYEKNIFPEIWNISDMLYKISDYEYCEFFKVQVIVDVYTGDSKSLKLFNPIFMLNKKQCSNEIFYKYRKVLTRESFDEPVILGVKREKYFKNKKCIYSD